MFIWRNSQFLKLYKISPFRLETCSFKEFHLKGGERESDKIPSQQNFFWNDNMFLWAHELSVFPSKGVSNCSVPNNRSSLPFWCRGCCASSSLWQTSFLLTVRSTDFMHALMPGKKYSQWHHGSRFPIHVSMFSNFSPKNNRRCYLSITIWFCCTYCSFTGSSFVCLALVQF